MKNKKLLIINILTLIAFIVVVYLGVSNKGFTKDDTPKTEKKEVPVEFTLDEKLLEPTYDYEYKKVEGTAVPVFTLELDPNAFDDVQFDEENVMDEEESLDDGSALIDDGDESLVPEDVLQNNTNQEIRTEGHGVSGASPSPSNQINRNSSSVNTKTKNKSNQSSQYKTPRQSDQPAEQPKSTTKPVQQPIKDSKPDVVTDNDTSKQNGKGESQSDVSTGGGESNPQENTNNKGDAESDER